MEQAKPILWEGASYKSDGFRGKRLLILGESAYGSRTWTQDEQNGFILANLTGTESHSFYTKVYHSFSDVPKRVSMKQFREFWDSIAFYNYIQETVGPRPKYRPEIEMWVRWKEPCVAIIGSISPNRILVLGRQLWRTLHDLKLLRTHDDTTSDFIAENATVKCSHIPHPASVGFRPSDWRALTSQLMQ
jgi:hypothetical protein